MFIIAGILKRKPVLPADAPSRSKPGGPFINPDPEEVVTDLGTTHRLLINKYGILRPMTVISTTEYALQSDDLDLSDIDAAWSVLKVFKTPSLIIYNCGVNAGSSQGHKHTQVFPLPEHVLWPTKARSTEGKHFGVPLEEVAKQWPDISTDLEYIPFKHYVLRLPRDTDAKTVYNSYLRLLRLAREALASSGDGSDDYNVAITADWVAVIPRRTSDGPYGANAAAMLGIIYVPDQHERDSWVDVGYTKHLATLGIPIEA